MSWSEEEMVRTDGGTPDIGYPKAVLLDNGHLLLVYYFNDGPGLERYIAASLIQLGL
jgi:hypothetical protein